MLAFFIFNTYGRLNMQNTYSAEPPVEQF